MGRPIKTITCGDISGSIWAKTEAAESNSVNDYSIRIAKFYWFDEEDYSSTDIFATEDLPKVALVANEAYRYLRLRSSDEENQLSSQ